MRIGNAPSKEAIMAQTNAIFIVANGQTPGGLAGIYFWFRICGSQLGFC
jgi:hypothetical protein